jgi:hypothetical protein
MVGACARPAVGSACTERTEGASQARGSFNTGSVCWGWRPVQPVSCSRAPSIRLVASRTTCRSSSVNSAARYSTIQAILGRSWIIHGVSRSPGAKSECGSCVSWVSRLPQVGHLGAGVVMHGSMVRAEVPVHLVRAGSAWHRGPLVVGGYERSRRAGRSRRPPRLPPTTSAVERRGSSFESHLPRRRASSSDAKQPPDSPVRNPLGSRGGVIVR